MSLTSRWRPGRLPIRLLDPRPPHNKRVACAGAAGPGRRRMPWPISSTSSWSPPSSPHAGCSPTCAMGWAG